MIVVILNLFTEKGGMVDSLVPILAKLLHFVNQSSLCSENSWEEVSLRMMLCYWKTVRSPNLVWPAAVESSIAVEEADDYPGLHGIFVSCLFSMGLTHRSPQFGVGRTLLGLPIYWNNHKVGTVTGGYGLGYRERPLKRAPNAALRLTHVRECELAVPPFQLFRPILFWFVPMSPVSLRFIPIYSPCLPDYPDMFRFAPISSDWFRFVFRIIQHPRNLRERRTFSRNYVPN